VLGASVLGLGLAGSVITTGTAEHLASSVESANLANSVDAGVIAPSAVSSPAVSSPAVSSRSAAVSRSSARVALSAAAVAQRAEQRVASLGKTDRQLREAAQSKALERRDKSLAKAASAARKKNAQLKKKERAARAARAARHARKRASRASLPIRSGYHIAAHFGQTGSWSRYHTGLDFAAPVGTAIHAPAAGVVTHAGAGRAGWAGHYVTIKHHDGKSTLYAHMSRVSVHVGEEVSAGEVIGAIGLTGRTFGPHVHFEVYPAGVRPGDLYKAIDPAPWLRHLGLHP
jgi:murein DD-endopeptidase MepM/ murein hydrolase activator NlpD